MTEEREEGRDEAMAGLGRELATIIGRNEGILKQEEELGEEGEKPKKTARILTLVMNNLAHVDIEEASEKEEHRYELEYEIDYPDEIQKGIDEYEELEGVGEQVATRLYHQFGEFGELKTVPNTEQLSAIKEIDATRAEEIRNMIHNECS